MTDFRPYFAFLDEADRLKRVERASVLMDDSRAENSAEHSWHVALFALVFAPEELDLGRVLAMILLHDLVEIDSGDHPIHLDHDLDAVARAEEAAALRLFGLLPDGAPFLALWREFEAAATPRRASPSAWITSSRCFRSCCPAGRAPITWQSCATTSPPAGLPVSHRNGPRPSPRPKRFSRAGPCSRAISPNVWPFSPMPTA
ncbi:HD domain-containing protein [Paracoccus cavernae]|uniref:HD domain-containing protein n=1 Tax=Paracoccus cavernae TaxID=1571207 RepID=UPI0036343C90